MSAGRKLNAWSTCRTPMSSDVGRDPVQPRHLDRSWRSHHRVHAPGLGGFYAPEPVPIPDRGQERILVAVAARATCYNLVMAKIVWVHVIVQPLWSGYQR